ncbi:CWF19-like protein 1 isoform X2 [Paramacrobiotus metropolitanus]|uniref:CWF19-like protein 1 isoform X2 n=1 Tax=Paramacrobiotus metropolitanus TaxID=2943436 RepID=UPI0024463182|nr:CWF19-like protein 1 isoform X2 [Paramacrobiotus metropolitanus]
MAGNVKILVVGDVEGRFATVFSKINALHKKNGPFEAVFCVGNFFGDDNSEWSQVQQCSLQINVATYILGPIFAEHVRFYAQQEAGDLAPNLTYLGQRGIFTFGCGLKVAYLSGKEAADPSSSDASAISFNQQSVEEVATLAGGNTCPGVDLLLTSQWPAGVEKLAGQTSVDSAQIGSGLIAQLAQAIKPRYHFAGLTGVFYERLPYRNHQVLAESAVHVTRFVGLASAAAPANQRFLYAFNVIPMAKISMAELRRQPEQSTPCPYERKVLATKKEKMEDVVSRQYFYDVLSGPAHGGKRKHDAGDRFGGGKRERRQHDQQEEESSCWFCLSSPQVEKHLVVSVGLHTYVALAKGGLNAEHVLILPITHLRSTPELDDDAVDELERYKKALVRFFAQQNKSTVFFERNYKSKHMQLQVVAVPRREPEKIKELFLQRAEENQLKLTEIPSRSDLRQIMKPGQTFFFAEFDDGSKLLYKIDKKGFPLQFGRDVLAGRAILNVPERLEWRECQISRTEEEANAAAFKSAFRPYDFNFE